MPKRTGPRSRKNKQIFIEETDIDPHEDPDHEYEVETILDKAYQEGKPQYFVKWKGYDETWNTWEPTHVLKCPLAIKDFEETLRLKKSSAEKEVVPEKEKVQSNVSIESFFHASDEDKNCMEAASVSNSDPISQKSLVDTEAGNPLKSKMTSKKNKTSPVGTDESNAKTTKKDVEKLQEETNPAKKTDQPDRPSLKELPFPSPLRVIRRQRSDLLPSSTVTSKTDFTATSLKFSSSSTKTPVSKKDGKREKQFVSFDIFKDWYPKELLEYLQQFICYKETPRVTQA